MPITAPIWELEPHTKAKHIILKKYLEAWLPIITRYNGRVLYIDGFSGPGKYKGGEDGSPIIAIKSVLGHRINMKSEIMMLFIEKEIPKMKHKIGYVFMCFATDPFMYQMKQVQDLSLKIIKRLNQDNIKIVSISKGIYPKELIKKDIYGGNNEYGSTIVSLSEDFRKKYEPFAAPIKQRIKHLRYLHDNGLKTWVSIEPYPTPNILKQDIKKILKEVSFVDKIVFGKWNYNGVIGMFKDYKKFYDETAKEVIKFCEKHGIDVHIKERTMTESKNCEKCPVFSTYPKQKILFGN